MRIALLSPFCSQNYGTVLQAFALAKVIESKGVQCEYIKWRRCEPSVFKRILFLLRHPTYFFLHSQNVKLNNDGLKYSFLSQSEYQEVIKKNEKFVNAYTPFSSIEYTYDRLKCICNKYDRFIVGSDQTWNPSHIYQFSPYYLKFVKEESKKFSYGCSLGRTSLPENFVKYLGKTLSSFKMLSCREKENAEMLSKRTGKNVFHVLDPTLLLDKESWSPYMRPVNGMPKEYILCYILGEKKIITDYAEFLGKTTNLPVYYILTRPCHANHSNVLKGMGVQEFLWLIDNCRYMVTDSFHGTIFSMNFGKNMVSFDKLEGDKFDNGRIKDVLSYYGIQNHYMKTYEERIPEDYCRNDILKLLQKKRKDSLDFLYRIIE